MCICGSCVSSSIMPDTGELIAKADDCLDTQQKHTKRYVSEPPPIVVVFCKLHKEVLEDSKRMHKNTEQLFDHLDLLFSEWDETQLVAPTFSPDQDPVESARLVTKIYELDNERRELDRRSDQVTQRFLHLLSQQTVIKLNAAEYTELVSEYIKCDKMMKEENKKLDHFMEGVFAHCSSHLASIFHMLLEE